MGLLGWIGLGGKDDNRQSDVMTSSEGATSFSPVLTSAFCPNTQKDLLKAKVQKQLASQYLNELAEKISNKCFDRCFVSDEGACTALCADRYLDTFNEVRKALVSRNRR